MIKEPNGIEAYATSGFGFVDITCSLKAQSHYKVAEPFVCPSPIVMNWFLMLVWLSLYDLNVGVLNFSVDRYIFVLWKQLTWNESRHRLFAVTMYSDAVRWGKTFLCLDLKRSSLLKLTLNKGSFIHSLCSDHLSSHHVVLCAQLHLFVLWFAEEQLDRMAKKLRSQLWICEMPDLLEMT